MLSIFSSRLSPFLHQRILDPIAMPDNTNRHLLPDPALAAYDLAPPVVVFTPAGAGINNRTIGIRSGDGAFIWKTYQTHDDPEAIRYEHRLLTWLGQQDLSFAVPAPIPTRSGDTLVASADGWKALFVQLPGGPPDHDRIDQMEAVGAALGELHCTLSAYPPEQRPHFYGYGALRQVHPHLPDPFHLGPAQLELPEEAPYVEWLAWWRDEMAELAEFTEHVYARLPHQMTHGDYVPSNTLVHAGQLTAVLDFDIAQPDARAIDMAMGLEFTLRIWERTDPFAFGAAFWRGYRRWVQPTAAEIAAMPTLIRLRDSVSTIWWLGRGLAAGTVEKEIWRIEDQRKMKVWLEANEQQLRSLLGREP